jgi:hypothetical protein
MEGCALRILAHFAWPGTLNCAVMPLQFPSGNLLLSAAILALATVSCAQSPPDAAGTLSQQPGCLVAGDGNLQAQLRGALVADVAWRNDQMQCEGGQRPDGQGLRVTIAGPLPTDAALSTGNASRPKLRFIFGIDLHDAAAGTAQALPTNLTIIIEGEQQLYATRGDDKCAVEILQRTPLAASGGKFDRVAVRGYCTGPAADLSGNIRLLVPTFSFIAQVRNGDNP